MMLMPLFEEEKARLKRLAQDKSTLFALKKLFINAVSERPASYEVNFLAAQRLAINMLYDIFHDLENTQPDSKVGRVEENMI